MTGGAPITAFTQVTHITVGAGARSNEHDWKRSIKCQMGSTVLITKNDEKIKINTKKMISEFKHQRVTKFQRLNKSNSEYTIETNGYQLFVDECARLLNVNFRLSSQE